MNGASDNTNLSPANNEHKLSLAAAFGAYAIWGILPIYWKLLDEIPAPEIMAHRILWSFIMLIFMVIIGKKLSNAWKTIRRPRILLMLTCTSALLASNWLIYIWAVNSSHVLEASLGYYINPLLNILFGVLVFKDRPSRLQVISFIIAVIGVLGQVIILGHLPWISLALAFTFAIYGVLRKIIDVESTEGLFLETGIMTPFVLVYLGYLLWSGQSHFALGGAVSGATSGLAITDFLLIGTALITTFPLIWFAYSAKRLSLITLGLIQYLTPSMAFLLGIFVFKERFTSAHLVSFGCIWVAVLVYSYDSMRMYRLAHRKY